MQRQEIIITAPSLDPTKNVSGISSVASLIIANNEKCEYLHFQLGKEDDESGAIWKRLRRVGDCYQQWRDILAAHPDALIHYNWPLSRPSIIRDYPFMRYALKQGRKMIVHLHGGQFLDNDNTPSYLEHIMRKVFSWDIPFIVLSESEKDHLQNKYGTKHVSVLPNSVDLSPAADVVRNEPFGELRLGYLGRIECHKGMGDLLEACRLLKEESASSHSNVEVSLQMAGLETNKDEYIPRFKRLLGNRFSYCGIVSGSAKDEFLRSTDVFVLPSHFEGLPMSLLESMSYGCVPVVTPVGSIPTICKDEVNALQVKQNNPESIANAIMRLYKEPRLFKRLSDAARQTVFEEFSSEDYILQLNKIYHANV